MYRSEFHFYYPPLKFDFLHSVIQSQFIGCPRIFMHLPKHLKIFFSILYNTIRNGQIKFNIWFDDAIVFFFVCLLGFFLLFFLFCFLHIYLTLFFFLCSFLFLLVCLFVWFFGVFFFKVFLFILKLILFKVFALFVFLYLFTFL